MPADRQELLFAWRVGYDAPGRGEANHFQDVDLRAAWELGNLAARSVPVGIQPKTIVEVAAELGISTVRVKQLQKRAIDKMRAYARRLAG